MGRALGSPATWRTNWLISPGAYASPTLSAGFSIIISRSPTHADRAALQYGQLPSIHFLYTRSGTKESDEKSSRLVAAELSPDGEWLAVADQKKVYLAPAGGKSGEVAPLEADPDPVSDKSLAVSSLAFSPDGNY